MHEVGHLHNAFLNRFEGRNVPPDQFTLVQPERSDPEATHQVIEEIDAYHTVVIHLIRQEKPHPGHAAFLTIGSLKGTLVGIEFYQISGPIPAPLEMLRKHHPDLHRVLTDDVTLKITTSYESLHPFLVEFARPDVARNLVDAVLMGLPHPPPRFRHLRRCATPLRDVGVASARLDVSWSSIRAGSL